MLLRSASTPVLKAFGYQKPSPEADLPPIIAPARPIFMSLKRTCSEGNLMCLSISKHKIFSSSTRPSMSPTFLANEKVEMSVCMETGTLSLLDDRSVGIAAAVQQNMPSLGGGSMCGGGDSGGGGDDNGFWNSGHGNENLDVHYQSMIKTYPDDALLLANYAKFLKEVRGDAVKAEEFCERAILANVNDGNVLSMYGHLIWNNHNDTARARSYFDQAVRSSPEDCHVLASYASFLWDAGEEEEEEEENEQKQTELSTSQACVLPHDLPRGNPPLAATF